jgi:hypothetical protein
LSQLVPQLCPFEPQLLLSLHFPATPQLSHLPSAFLSTKAFPLVQFAVFPQSVAFTVLSVVALVAGLVVEATWEKVIPVKKTRIAKVNNTLDAVFIVFCFL